MRCKIIALHPRRLRSFKTEIERNNYRIFILMEELKHANAEVGTWETGLEG